MLRRVIRKPYVVLVGSVGAGKSTLAQKLLQKPEDTGAQGFGWSATKASTKYSSTTFDFADTPGLKARKEKLDHAINIVIALTADRPVSRIFVLVKYSERLDDFVNDAELIVRPFHPWKDLMTIIVTHWEQSKQTIECKQAISQAINEELGVRSILFSSKATKGAEIAAQMKETFVCLPRRIQIEPEHIVAYFDIKKNDMAIMDYLKKKIAKYNVMVEKSMEKADRFQQNDPKKDDFLFYSQVALKGVIEQWKEEFCAKFLNDVTEPEEYATLDALNSSLRDAFRGYRAYCLQFWNFSEGTDNFRKCPFCGEVWIKVEGCNGSTLCGARPGTGDRPVKTIWSWILTDDDIVFEFKSVKYAHLINLDKTARGTGCGRSITWKDMQPVNVERDFFEAPETVKSAQDIATASTSVSNAFKSKINQKLNSTKLIDKTVKTDYD